MKRTSMRDLSNEELENKLSSLQEELFNLRARNALHQLDNPMRIRMVRRDIARAKTEITARAKTAGKG